MLPSKRFERTGQGLKAMGIDEFAEQAIDAYGARKPAAAAAIGRSRWLAASAAAPAARCAHDLHRSMPAKLARPPSVSCPLSREGMTSKP